MKCFNHENRDAVSVCSNCGRGLCIDCSIIFKPTNKIYCNTCTLLIEKDPKMLVRTIRALRYKRMKE